MNTSHYTFVQTHSMCTTESKPNVNYELGVMMTCQCRFINFNKCTDLGGGWGVDNGRGYACIGERRYKIFHNHAHHGLNTQTTILLGPGKKHKVLIRPPIFPELTISYYL